MEALKDFWWDYRELLILLTAILAIMAILTAGAAWLSKVGCESRWQDSGRAHSWGLMAGCRVADRDGRLIPEKNVRDID